MSELRKNINGFTGTSNFNALDFMIQSTIKGMINTAIPVRVDAIERPADASGATYLSATPLICQRDADGNALPSVSIPKLRWFRYQHGTAAIICDPKPGDIGLAIFAQQDVSTLSGGNQPVQPGSFRCFDMSDGFYIGGFWGQKPTTYIRIEDTGDITIIAPTSTKHTSPTITVNCDTATVNATQSVNITAPNTNVDGKLTVTGLITGQGGMAISGGSGATVDGNFAVSNGDVSADDISLKSHVHGGVESGGSTTSTPQ